MEKSNDPLAHLEEGLIAPDPPSDLSLLQQLVSTTRPQIIYAASLVCLLTETIHPSLYRDRQNPDKVKQTMKGLLHRK